MTTTADVTNEWGGIPKQLHDFTAEQVKRNTVGGEGPIDYKATVADGVAAIEKQLTSDINAMYALRRKIEATVTKTRGEARVKVAVYERIGKHIFEMQQGNRAPVIDMNALRHAERNHNSNAATKRELEINRLKLVRMIILEEQEDVFTPILIKSLSRLPKEHKNIARTPREVLLADSGCRDQLHGLLSAAADAQTKKLELFPVTNIQDRITELKQQIDGSKDADEIEQVQAELVKLRSPEAEHIAILRRREVTPLAEFAQQVADTFINWAIKSLEGCHAEGVRHEKQMFADLSFPWEETVISRRYTQAIAEVKQLNTPLKVLNWFGMPSLTHVAEQLEQATK
jgi:hypothetical protein